MSDNIMAEEKWQPVPKSYPLIDNACCNPFFRNKETANNKIRVCSHSVFVYMGHKIALLIHVIFLE